MVVLIIFAFISGVITILSPCILPLLPVLLSGSMGNGKARPFGVIAGFALSFTIFTLALSAIVQALGIPSDSLRWAAVALIILFGLVLLFPQLTWLFERATFRVAGIGGRSSSARHGGFWSGLLMGLSLGIVWTPCVGPIMASVISLAITKHVDSGSVLITLAYSLGTAIPMLAIMLGGRALLEKLPFLKRRAAPIQRGFGLLMIILGVAISFGFDRSLQSAILSAFPSYGSGLTAVEQVGPVTKALAARTGKRTSPDVNAAEVGRFSGVPAGVAATGQLGDYGKAPPFIARGPWLNLASASGLSLDDLRGKVILVDFWTYSCVNCIRTLPYLRAWYEAYKDKGFIIIGVHSPEFEFEKVTANVSAAMRDLGVTWPVVQDNDYAEWQAYGNQYWPAHYLIDAKGRVRSFHFGEGEYEATERLVQALLKEAGSETSGLVTKGEPQLESRTPETYLGYERGTGLRSPVAPEADRAVEYKMSGKLGNGEWGLSGKWTISSQYIAPESEGRLSIEFDAKDLFLVVRSDGNEGTISVSLDGRPAPDSPDVRGGVLRPTESRLYQLVKLSAGGEHRLDLVVKGSLKLFAFTFG